MPCLCRYMSWRHCKDTFHRYAGPPEAKLARWEETDDSSLLKEADPQQRDSQDQEAKVDAVCLESNKIASSRPQYLEDLDRAEEAERRLASGEGLQGAEKEAEAPSDPIDSLRSSLVTQTLSRPPQT